MCGIALQGGAAVEGCDMGRGAGTSSRATAGLRATAGKPAVVVMSALLAACSVSERGSGAVARMSLPDGVTTFGATIPDVPRTEPVTFGALPVCSIGSGAVEVTAVSVHAGSGIVVNAFGVDADLADGFGMDFVDLSAAGFDSTAHTLEAPCGTPGELAVELERTSVGTGTAEGFDVTYRTSAGDTEDLHLPFIVVLCAPEDSRTQDC